MHRDLVIKKVLAKLSDDSELHKNMSKHNQKIKDMAKKYKTLTPENAIEYAKVWEDYRGYKVMPKTRKTKEHGETIIEVKLEGDKGWYPVWFDPKLGGLYGEY